MKPVRAPVVAVVALLTMFAVFGGFAHAQGRAERGGGGREVYCASNDNRGARCQVPWRHAELSRQMSDAPCIEGQTWGSDRYSVWVKKGCRGQFREARGGYRHW